MRIPFLWDMTHGHCGIVLYILPHDEVTMVTPDIGIGFLIDHVSHFEIG